MLVSYKYPTSRKAWLVEPFASPRKVLDEMRDGHHFQLPHSCGHGRADDHGSVCEFGPLFDEYLRPEAEPPDGAISRCFRPEFSP